MNYTKEDGIPIRVEATRAITRRASLITIAAITSGVSPFSRYECGRRAPKGQKHDPSPTPTAELRVLSRLTSNGRLLKLEELIPHESHDETGFPDGRVAQ